MFPILPEPEPSTSDIALEEDTEEESEQLPQDELRLETLHDIEECFQIFDPTKSGQMDIKYLDKAFRCLGIYLTTYEMDELKKILNKNGSVLFEDFQAYALDKISEKDAYDTLQEAFQVFDPDNEGIVPTDRFKKWMTTLGDPLTEKEAKDLAKMGDPGNKGVLTYSELIAILVIK